MTITIVPATLEDVPALFGVGTEAFRYGFHELMYSTQPLSTTSVEKLVDTRRKALHDSKVHVFKAIDTDSNEIIGGSKWVVHTEEQVWEKSLPEVVEGIAHDAVPEVRVPVLREFYTKIFSAKMENQGFQDGDVFKVRPRLELESLYTHPKHQRRGFAKLLLQWGINEADRLGLDAYLEATAEGTPVYEKQGFKEIGSFTINAMDFGLDKKEFKYTVCLSALEISWFYC